MAVGWKGIGAHDDTTHLAPRRYHAVAMTPRHTLLVRALATAATGVVLAAGFVAAQDGPAPSRANTAVPDRAKPLPLTAVRLTGGPLKVAQDLDAKYLLDLDPDRMLAYFRLRAGLPKNAEPYGGWDGGGRNLTGHIAGHHLSAISLMWAATGDARFKDRVDYMVRQLKAVQDKHGDGYLMAVEGAREAFAAVMKGDIRTGGFDLNGLWVPWYTAHKLFAGLRDAYRYAGSRTALESRRNSPRGLRASSRLDEAQMQRMLSAEHGGMAEVLADLSVDTGDARWLTLSRRFDHHACSTRWCARKTGCRVCTATPTSPS